MSAIWKSFRIDPSQGDWEPASYNVQPKSVSWAK